MKSIVTELLVKTANYSVNMDDYEEINNPTDALLASIEALAIENEKEQSLLKFAKVELAKVVGKPVLEGFSISETVRLTDGLLAETRNSGGQLTEGQVEFSLNLGNWNCKIVAFGTTNFLSWGVETLRTKRKVNLFFVWEGLVQELITTDPRVFGAYDYDNEDNE
jgi:hypothetical protein